MFLKHLILYGEMKLMHNFGWEASEEET